MLENNEELKLLEDKVEDLIARAVDEGANVDFQDVRVRLDVAKEFGLRRPFSIAIAQLEEGIAAAKREKAKRASRRSLVVKFKNLIGIG